MRARVLLVVCLALNILLAVALVWVWERPVPSPAASPAAATAKTEARPPRTHVVVRRHGFTWSEVESADFPTYIKNLRDIGCPEHTIRDIIVAEVDDLFADRMAKELNLPEQKWWLPDPDMEVLQSGMDQVRALQTEKELLLTALLGEGWQEQRNVAASAIRFDGPVLANISTEAKANVERIEANARRTSSEIAERARAEGREITQQERARLRQETRRELAAVLNPEQLEEYLLRYSQTADEMRAQLRGFGANAEEFRGIFRAQDQFDQQLAALNDDAASATRRAELSRIRDAAVRQAIGPERFALYQASQNPLFRQAQEQAEQTGAPPEKVLPIFRVNEAVAGEIARIQADATLSEDQRRIALVTVQQQQQNSIQRILTEQPADEPAAPPVPQVSEAPSAPLPPFPQGFDRVLRANLGPPTPAEQGANTTTKGPTYRGRR
jgi:hypothetical protein